VCFRWSSLGSPPTLPPVSEQKDPSDDVAEESAALDENDGKDETAEVESRRARTERPAGALPKKKRPRREAERLEAKTAASSPLFVLIALGAVAVGAAGGWFGHDAQAKAKLKADSVPAAAGSGAPSGPCGAWQQKICAGNDTSAACEEAKAAVQLLTPSTCEVALAAVPATLAKVKAARVQCDSLVSKLCGDLPPGSQTCNMVRERTPSFPTERCTEMLAHYADVLASLKQMDQAGGPQMRAPGMGQPPGVPGGPGAPGTR
jgi:hypothetical protein